MSIPSQLAGQLLAMDAALPVILRVRQLSALGAPAGRPLHLAWAGDVAAAAGVLEVPSALGRALGLLSGSQVVLEPLPEGAVAAAEMVVVEPVGPSDWEVVELNAGLLEDRLLTQVSASFSFPGWNFGHVCSKISAHTKPAQDSCSAWGALHTVGTAAAQTTAGGHQHSAWCCIMTRTATSQATAEGHSDAPVATHARSSQQVQPGAAPVAALALLINTLPPTFPPTGGSGGAGAAPGGLGWSSGGQTALYRPAATRVDPGAFDCGRGAGDCTQATAGWCSSSWRQQQQHYQQQPAGTN